MTDEELMRAYVKNGDSAAFDALFQRYAPQILAMGLRHLRNRDEAEELIQQTFLRIHRARNDFRLSEKFRPWAVTIAMNLVRERWRRRKRRPEVSLEHAPDPAAEADQARGRQVADTQALVRRALGALPASQREVVELHWFQDQPFKEVARRVGASEGAVRVRAHRAYEKLRSVLEGKVDDV